MTLRSRLLTTVSATVLLFAATACAPGGGGNGGSGGSGDGGSGGSGGSDAAAACAGVADGGYELFTDDRLTVAPELDVYPLAASGDSIAFTDTAPDGFTTYSYSTYYIDKGNAFPNDAAIFVGAEDTQSFQLDGPIAPSGVDGGPYPGIVEIEATNDAGTTVIGRYCVQFAASE
jgi:hypothetical protein